MSDTGKQNPLGINNTCSLIRNAGLKINDRLTSYVGTSKTNSHYSPGSTINSTCLRVLTAAINVAFNSSISRGLSSATYNSLITIGQSSIPILGNAPPAIWPTSTTGIDFPGRDPQWSGEATTGYGVSSSTDGGQSAKWIPYTYANSNNSVTQWGFLRCFALQAWNEFNWNGDYSSSSSIRYKDFCSSFLQVNGYINFSNSAIYPIEYGKSYLSGVYSNMNDLITADITSVTVALAEFGRDCMALGRVIDLSQIAAFGLPSRLLQTLRKNNAISQSLSLALVSSGIELNQINDIINGTATSISNKEEQQIYGAFSIITGQDLLDVLLSLNCKTTGLSSLADLLNVKKIFPNSFRSLTVPLYNLNTQIKTSKINYLIFSGTEINSQLKLPQVKNQIGTLIVPGSPSLGEAVKSAAEFQELSTGFGSYLDKILPEEVAIAAGAFSIAMRQIKNVEKVNFELFSQVVGSMETTKGHDIVNGSGLPTDQTLVAQGLETVAHGSGPYGTYNFSDFFGCMSALPYLWEQMHSGIVNLQTTKLFNIYDELYLAVDWNGATVTVQYTVIPGPPDTYQVTGITLTGNGGGYGRGGAPAPTITISGGASASCVIGTNNKDLTTFGKVISVSLTSAGSPSASVPTIAIESPPTASLAVQVNGNKATGGTNTSSGTSGWPGMNSVVLAYITQSNTEIQTKMSSGVSLNIMYESAVKQLILEQRERFHAINPVAVPRDSWVNPHTLSIYSFIDSIPSLAQNTAPHMSAQTLDAISDVSTMGGNSLVVQQRQERNQTRLLQLGIPVDNNVSDGLQNCSEKVLITNGTLPVATSGVEIPNIATFTNPAILPGTQPVGFVNPVNCSFMAGKPNPGVSPIQTMLNYPTNVEQTNVTTGPIVGTAPVVTTGPITGPGIAVETSTFVPTNLNMDLISGIIVSSTYTVEEAINQVIKSNCDCWCD